jgi:hypothetical protein
MSRRPDHRARARPALLPVRDGRRAGQLAGITTWWGLGLSIISGLIAGNVIAYATEYYTSYEHKPTQRIAEQALTGPATVIISGIAEGMKSTWASLLTVVVAIIAAFSFAGGGDSFLMGLYGVGIAAVGMLSTLGITLATDAYGPIADNAGGNAEMTGQPPHVRERTDMLDSLGNTTAATGKGFAIGSAALTALALFAAYIQIVQTQITTQAESCREVGPTAPPARTSRRRTPSTRATASSRSSARVGRGRVVDGGMLIANRNESGVLDHVEIGQTFTDIHAWARITTITTAKNSRHTSRPRESYRSISSMTTAITHTARSSRRRVRARARSAMCSRSTT